MSLFRVVIVACNRRKILKMAIATLYGNLFQFDPNEHNWTEFIEIYQHYFTANNIEDENRKVSILCSNVGPKTYHIIKSLCLPDKPNEKSFDFIITTVKNHYKPKLSEASASLLFNSRNQKNGETVQIYVAELRRLAVPCNFGEFLNRAIKDRFIAGVNDKEIQQKILAVPDEELSLTKAFQIAEAYESACHNVEQMQKNTGTDRATVNKLHHTQKSRGSQFLRKKGENFQNFQNPSKKGEVIKSDKKKGEQSCYRCNGNHDPKTCWFKDQKCHKCEKRGHAKKACKSESITYVAAKVSYDSDGPEEMFHIKKGNAKVPPITIDLRIEGKTIEFEVDTGSTFSLISENCAKQLSSYPRMKQSKLNLTLFKGHKVTVLGEIETVVSYHDNSCLLKLIVTDHKRVNLRFS